MPYSVDYKQASSSAHTQARIILECGHWGHLGTLPTPGSLFVSLCVVWLLMLIALDRIFCSCWRETFQEQVSPPSVLHADFITTGLKFGNRRWQEVLTPLPWQFIPSTALSLSQEQQQVQYRKLTINSKSPQITRNYRREDNLTQRDFSIESTPSRKTFCLRRNHRGGSASKTLQMPHQPSNWYLWFQRKINCLSPPLCGFTKPPAAGIGKLLDLTPHCSNEGLNCSPFSFQRERGLRLTWATAFSHTHKFVSALIPGTFPCTCPSTAPPPPLLPGSSGSFSASLLPCWMVFSHHFNPSPRLSAMPPWACLQHSP